MEGIAWRAVEWGDPTGDPWPDDHWEADGFVAYHADLHLWVRQPDEDGPQEWRWMVLKDYTSEDSDVPMGIASTLEEAKQQAEAAARKAARKTSTETRSPTSWIGRAIRALKESKP